MAATLVSTRTGECAEMPRPSASSGIDLHQRLRRLRPERRHRPVLAVAEVDGLGRGQGERVVPRHLVSEPGFARAVVRERPVPVLLKRDGVDLHQPRARFEALLQVLPVARFPGPGQSARMVLQLRHGDPGGLQHVVQRRLAVAVPELLVEAHPPGEVEEDVGVGAGLEPRLHNRRPVLQPCAGHRPLGRRSPSRASPPMRWPPAGGSRRIAPPASRRSRSARRGPVAGGRGVRGAYRRLP